MKISAETGEIIREYEGEYFLTKEDGQYEHNLDISNDGQFLAVGIGEAPSVHIINTETGAVYKEFRLPDDIIEELSFFKLIRSVSFSHDFNMLAVAVQGLNNLVENIGFLIVYNIETGEIIHQERDNYIAEALFSPTDNLLAVCRSNSSENRIDVYDTDNWDNYVNFCCHSLQTDDIAFSPDGSKLASCSWDGLIKIWDIQEKKIISTTPQYKRFISVEFFNEDIIIGGANDNHSSDIYSWDFKQLKQKKSYFVSRPNNMSLSYLQNKLVVADYKSVTLINLDDIVSVHTKPDIIKTVSPNPFNSSTILTFLIPQPGNYKVEIFNSRSDLIKTLHDGYLNSTENKFTWRSDNKPSGTYYCKITGKDFSETLTIVLEK